MLYTKVVFKNSCLLQLQTLEFRKIPSVRLGGNSQKGRYGSIFEIPIPNAFTAFRRHIELMTFNSSPATVDDSMILSF